MAAPVRIQFERRMKQLQADTLRMGALVENSFLLAHQSLFEKNIAAATQLSTQDKQVDAIYRQIEQSCIEFIALQSPVAKDLRLISALMHLVRDLERIGDYAQDLGELALRLVAYPDLEYLPRVEHMSNLCRDMLAQSLESLTRMDATLGYQIKHEDDAVDDSYRNLYQELASIHSWTGSVEPILLLVLVIRHLERMADHATNIGKRVAYVVTGQT